MIEKDISCVTHHGLDGSMWRLNRSHFHALWVEFSCRSTQSTLFINKQQQRIIFQSDSIILPFFVEIHEKIVWNVQLWLRTAFTECNKMLINSILSSY